MEEKVNIKKHEQLLRKLQDLSNEVDDLRLENQALRIELARFLNLSYSTRHTFRTFLSEIWYKLRHLKKMLARAFYSNESMQHDSSFKPYHVGLLYPPQSNRPRVLHAIGNFWTGGSSQLVVDLIEHLGHRFEQQVITRDNPPWPSYIGLRLFVDERFTNPRQAFKYFKKFKPDILHVHYLAHHRNDYSELDWRWYNNIFQAATEFGCKIIENVNIPVNPYVSESVNYYVYVSNFVRDKFGRRDSSNITIYPGSDIRFFSRQDKTPDDCIGMVYRLEGDKLNEQAIEVFIEVTKRRPRSKALIVGGGRYLETYRNIVQQSGVSEAFTFANYIPYKALPAFYEQMSIFVAPVHKESFGQVSPFAMAMGIPVVSYDVGALGEIIGDRTLLAPPGDHVSLANIIIELLDDRERRLRIGAINRQRAEQFFSLETMINSYNALYNKLITLH